MTAALWLATLWGLASAAEPALEFRTSKTAAARLTLAELKAKVPPREIRFASPFSEGRPKRYLAFPVAEVLDLAYGAAWRSEDYSDVAFIALDGYEAVGPLARLREEGGFLAFKDLDRAEGWEPVGRKKADPGPFFLVWTKPEQSGEDYPWPWQIAAVNLARFEDQYPAVVPSGGNPAVQKGFAIFKARCIRCHAMSRQGGKIGPDLNAPQSVTAYRSKRMIKAFIREPSKYRHTQMPDHPDLSEDDLESLYRYLRAKARDAGPRDSW